MKRCLCVVDLPDGLVEGRSFLDGYKASETHLLSDLLHGLGPFAQAVFLHQVSATAGKFLGHNFAALRLHQIFFRQTADGFCAGAVPHLPLLTDKGSPLGLFGLLGLSDNLAARNAAPGNSAAGPPHGFTSDSHCGKGSLSESGKM